MSNERADADSLFIRLEAISKTYSARDGRPVRAIEDISLGLSSGEFASILMDEPFGALDAMTREQMNLELQNISVASGATVVFVTHSISEAVFLSDRVMVMTGRPATLKEVVEIDIPRPRSLDMIASGLFGDHVVHLRRLLNARSDPA